MDTGLQADILVIQRSRVARYSGHTMAALISRRGPDKGNNMG